MMHLFPAIDLRGGKVVRLFKGDYDRQTTYDLDPLAQARRFEEAGATWLHLVDLDGARTGRMQHLQVIASICKNTQLQVEVGGGVRSSGTMDALLNAGAARVVLGTAALRDWNWFESLMGNPTYARRIVLGLDAHNGQLAVSGWEENAGLSALEVAGRVSDWPLGAIVYTDIATDGTLAGPNVEMTGRIAAATHVPIVASGGVGSLDHLRALRSLPLQGIIVGKALYENKFTLREALQVVEGP